MKKKTPPQTIQADIQPNRIEPDYLLKLYFEARNDYRNALNMEQTILSFCVAVLAIGTATGFMLFGQLSSWVIFSVIIPFLLSLVKILYLHQKHRSKTYKVYQAYIERLLDKQIDNFPGFELWKNKNSSAFVKKRRGFYYGFFGVLITIPYIFLSIGFVSYGFCGIPLPLLLAFFIILFIVVAGDIVCVKYALSINHILKKQSAF